jgi:hypothetical protein
MTEVKHPHNINKKTIGQSVKAMNVKETQLSNDCNH